MIRRTWLQMEMPVTICLQDDHATESDIDAIAAFLETINQRFSPYVGTSEVTRLNTGQISLDEISDELAMVLQLCEATRRDTDGYFNAFRDGQLDPSGLVKGWAIERCGLLLRERGLRNYFVDVGGDIEAVGLNGHGQPWRVGVRNPFRHDEQVKVLSVSDCGVATSGTAIRGQHIYDPWTDAPLDPELVSLTVIASTIYEADRMATAAFAMGMAGVSFLADRRGLEAYAIFADGTAYLTEGFRNYVG